MDKFKNIFLTTLGETRDRLDITYFASDCEDGSMAFASGISGTEAGIKYIMSKYHVDEIIVLGQPPYAGEDELKERTIGQVPIDNIHALEGMSEYGFLCYRLKEHLDQIDFEMLDIRDAITEEEAARYDEEIRRFRFDHRPEIGMKDLFVELSSDPQFAAQFEEKVLADKTPTQRKQIRHQLYSMMDSHHKLHSLSSNRDTTIRFMPFNLDDVIDIESVAEVVNETMADDNEDIRLMMDIQGLNAVEGNMLISTFLLMNSRIGYNCDVIELIKSEYDPGKFCGSIWNVRRSYDIQHMISGLDVFLEYGKDAQLKQYWSSLNIQEPEADKLLGGMDMVDEGTTLCHVDLIACGIDVIRKVVKDYDMKGGHSIYLDIMIRAIKADYGQMLEGEELSIPDLLKWSLRKGLYQQTLTFIESKIPADIIRRGIYYYAENEEDIQAIMRSFNLLYWNEPSRLRYAFNKTDHYFIKFYGRSAIDYRQKPDEVVRDFARLRVELLKGPQGDIPRAYSQLHDDELLYELLYSYYQISNLRNQINHAAVDRAAVVSDGGVKRTDSRIELHSDLEKFIDLYDTACRKTEKIREPVILEPRRFRSYARNHQIEPLETPTDLTQTNHYHCSFDGKDVLIRINMLKSEDDKLTLDDED